MLASWEVLHYEILQPFPGLDYSGSISGRLMLCDDFISIFMEVSLRISAPSLSEFQFIIFLYSSVDGICNQNDNFVNFFVRGVVGSAKFFQV